MGFWEDFWRGFSGKQKTAPAPTVTIDADLAEVRAKLILMMLEKGKSLAEDSANRVVFQGSRESSLAASVLAGDVQSSQRVYTFVLVQRQSSVTVAATALMKITGSYGDNRTLNAHGPYLSKWLEELKTSFVEVC
jgi:hypothetical protein